MSRSIDEQTWHRLTEEIMTGMREWRLQHPQATLRAMEEELDARWTRVRARMLEDMALASSAAAWAATPVSQHPTCPDCDTRLHDRGQASRQLQTHGGAALTLERSYGVCPACGAGLFPPG